MSDELNKVFDTPIDIHKDKEGQKISNIIIN